MTWTLLIQIVILMILAYLVVHALIERYFLQKTASRVVEYHRTVSMTPEQAGVDKMITKEN